MSARNTKVKRSFDTRTFGLHKKATELHKLSGANALVLTLYEGKIRCFSSHSANEWPIIRPIIEQLRVGDTLLGPGHFTSVSEHMSLSRGSSTVSDSDVVSIGAVLPEPPNPHLDMPSSLSNPGDLTLLDDDAVRQSYLVDLENLQLLQSGQSPVGQSVITRPGLSRPPTPPLTPSPPTTPSLPAIQDPSDEDWAWCNSKVLQDVSDSFSLGPPLLLQSLETDAIAEPIDPARSAPPRRSSKKEHRKRKRGTDDGPGKKRRGNPALTRTPRNAPTFS